MLPAFNFWGLKLPKIPKLKSPKAATFKNSLLDIVGIIRLKDIPVGNLRINPYDVRTL